MILEFSICNYRSIREKQVFSMFASGAKSKSNNTFDVDLTNGNAIKLIKTAAIYGANASGKSTITRALFEIQRFIVESDKIEVDKPIPAYEPFLFNTKSLDKPTEFEIIFLTRENNKYQYKIAFNEQEIVEESLYYFPKKKPQKIYIRSKETTLSDKNVHLISLGKNFGYRKYQVHKKLPLISIFRKAENYHADISPIYTFFDEIKIWNVTETSWVRLLANYVKEELQKANNSDLISQIEKLIIEADTQIKSLIVDPTKSKSDNNTLKDTTPKQRFERSEVLYGEHDVFENEKIKTKHALPFYNESFGTNKFFALGGLIVMIANRGGIIVFDELDSSLHPLLSSLLVRYFHNNHLANSQLIFTTHETFLLNKDFRSDQIWFTQKNKFGETELFSAQDFEGVREDIPFEKWYLGGKFGAIPYVQNFKDSNYAEKEI